ncbi:MAG: hypothetical protein RKO25_02445 [Candidatus Contendobacter sp.]|nr:hypothetical protein [Candidatus Contendobacter sp.]
MDRKNDGRTGTAHFLRVELASATKDRLARGGAGTDYPSDTIEVSAATENRRRSLLTGLI